MNARHRISKKFLVLSALAVVLVLGGSLGLRVIGTDADGAEPKTDHRPTAGRASSQSPGAPPAATVPAPKYLDPLTVAAPDWYDRDVQHRSVEFTIDLDAIAPFGDGPANAALWFRQFAFSDGARLAEFEAAMERRVEDDPFVGKHLPGDDPLLLEAEPWVDQAVMRHYPDVWELNGHRTAITNLLAIVTFARSWVARGNTTDDPELAREDHRRAIRLGRLIRQEDFVVINDLIGLTCIRFGLQGLYDLERREGNTDAAMLVALALGEVAPQRLVTSSLITEWEKIRLVRSWHLVGHAVEAGDSALQGVVGIAKDHPNRRFRVEALLRLHMVVAFGSRKQETIARETLEALAEGDDPLTAELARWCLNNDFNVEDYTGES
jgi:hypothetical protein